MRGQLIVNPETGIIDRIFKDGRSKHDIGTDNCGYKRLMVNGKAKYAHVLIWEFVHGTIPDGMVIDHKNGNKKDNRINNLRLVTHKQNSENRLKPNKNSKSGIKGVFYCNTHKCWKAAIYSKRKRYNLGTFSTKDDAAKAYALAAANVHSCNPAALVGAP